MTTQHSYFQIHIQDVHIEPCDYKGVGVQNKLKTKINTPEQLPCLYPDMKLCVFIDFDGSHHIQSESLKSPWNWNQMVCKFMYHTVWINELKRKLAQICILWKQTWPLDDIPISRFSIDLRSLFTGPKQYAITMYNIEETHALCTLSFTCCAESLSTQLGFVIDQIQLPPEMLNYLQTPNIYVSLNYITPNHFIRAHRRITLCSALTCADHTRHSPLLLNLQQYSSQLNITASMFLQSSVQLLFFNREDDGRVWNMIGCVLIPMLGLYSTVQPTIMTSTHFWWHDSVTKKHAMRPPDCDVKVNMIVKNGPRFAQMQSGVRNKDRCVGGKCIAGFPRMQAIEDDDSSNSSSVSTATLHHVYDHLFRDGFTSVYIPHPPPHTRSVSRIHARLPSSTFSTSMMYSSHSLLMMERLLHTFLLEQIQWTRKCNQWKQQLQKCTADSMKMMKMNEASIWVQQQQEWISYRSTCSWLRDQFYQRLCTWLQEIQRQQCML